jgi:hypothetical protein
MYREFCKQIIQSAMKNVCISLIVSGLLVISVKAFAQEENSRNDSPDKISTDRPGQSDAAFLLKKGWFQMETGTVMEADHSAAYNKRNFTYISNLVRYSLSGNMELRVMTEYIGNQLLSKDENESVLIRGFSPLSVGTKVLLNEEKGLLPHAALLTSLQLPVLGKKEFSPDGIVPTIKLMAYKTLSEKFSLTGNIGAKWDGQNAQPAGLYTLSLGMSITEKLSGFAETYGWLSHLTPPDNRADAGLVYLLTDNIQVDISGGMGLNKISPDYYISAGLSLRIKALNRLN